MSLITFIKTLVCSKICYNFSIFSKKKNHIKELKEWILKNLLYKMLVKYYLNNNINAPFENFTLGLGNTWVGPYIDF